ncbi:hypothetical protein ACFLT9_13415 [Acidobacteriota bacterium]
MKLGEIETEYREFLRSKTSRMFELLRTIDSGGLCPEIAATPLGAGFRNRLKFKIFPSESGFQCFGTDPLRGEVPVEDALWLAPPWAVDVFGACREILVSSRSHCPVDGFELQLTHGREEAHLTLSVPKSADADCSSLAADLLSGIPNLIGAAVPSQKLETGQTELKHHILGLDIHAHYRAFFQSNLHLTPRLVEEFLTRARNLDRSRIVDLYSGVGLFSLFLSGQGPVNVIGSDMNPYAISSAVKNAERIKPEQAEYHSLSVEKFLERFPLNPEDFVLLNPSRSGCSNVVVSGVASSRPKNVCLISCSFDTQVRDISGFVEEGYRIESISAFDMFPFTDFLETVVFLSL